MATLHPVWNADHIKTLSPDDKSIPAAREVLRKGGFGTVEPTTDGRGWWVVCRGITDTYQVSVRQHGTDFNCECTCPSSKYPCKHALALLLYLVDHPELRVEAEAPKVAASDFEGLIRAVFRESDDDTPRLVFADFLDENGQHDRAALIRYQCEQARLKSNAKRSKELAKLIDPLVAKLRKQIEPVPEGVEYAFHRGFIRMNTDVGLLNASALPARFTNLFREGWVETLVTSYLGELGGQAEAVSIASQVGELDLSDNPWLEDAELFTIVAETAEARRSGRLRRIKVHNRNQKSLQQLLRAEQGEAVTLETELRPERYHRSLTRPVFDLLLRTGQFDGARGLTLSGELGDAEITALLNADLSELRRLRLEGWVLTRAGVQSLANSRVLKQLETLDVELCDLGAGTGVEALAASTGLRKLETLRLAECGLQDVDVEELAKSRNFPNLTHLDLRHNNHITARGGAAILAAPHFPQLINVDLQDIRLDPRDRIPLALTAPDRECLTVSFTQITVRRWVKKPDVTLEIEARGNDYSELFDGLANCAGAKRVTQFSAPHLHIGAKEVAALAAGFDPKKLWRLDLNDNPLKNDGAAALATAFADFRIEELNLMKCRVQAGGVQALVASSLWKNLRALDLSNNNLGKAGVVALLDAEVPPKLRELVVTEYCLGVNDGKPGAKATRATGPISGEGKLKAKYGALLKIAKS